MIPAYETLLLHYRKGPNNTLLVPRTLLCFDPGGTTGSAIFFNGFLDSALEFHGDLTEQVKVLWQFMEGLKPDQIVCEDYRVYSHKLQQHNYSELFTPKLVGAIHAMATILEIPVVYQMAATAKGFCKDEKLEAWGMYRKGSRHCRDAIRHGCHYLLFGGRK